MGKATPPPSVGIRLEWAAMPAGVRSAVEDALGSPVVTATSQLSGFSPGVAARLQLADGRRLFLKAIGPTPNPDSPKFHRREAQVVAALPTKAPVPRLLGSYDEGEAGWIVLWFDDIEGYHPAQPWAAADLDRVMRALIDLSTLLTPSPLSHPFVADAADALRTEICGWTNLVSETPFQVDELDPWSRRHLAALVALEAEAPAAVVGDTLLHFDLRADNILLTPEQVWIVDWPHVRVGAAWADTIFFAPSVTMQGGPPPEQLLARHPASHGADQRAMTAVIAAVAGFFIHRSLQPAPPGLPTLRAFQAAQGAVARDWLEERTGWA